VAVPNTFAGGALDRAGARRADPAWLAERTADAGARAVVATRSGVLASDGAPARVPLGALAADTELVLLGVDPAGTALFAADPGDDDAAVALEPGAQLHGLRDLAPALGQADGGLLAQAVGLLNWHRRHRFCANCGASTDPAQAGHVRVCPRCGAEHHPRTDPVVIMLVTDGDRALLGRQRTWPPGRFSALAGFVEPGESLEEAVAREVLEESGVHVGEVRYRSSQPWPFPTSLMLGFTAGWAGGEPEVRDGELEAVGWFERADLAAGTVMLPPPQAIARRLIDGWLAEPRG
jgi:NAD+ diphosphatase